MHILSIYECMFRIEVHLTMLGYTSAMSPPLLGFLTTPRPWTVENEGWKKSGLILAVILVCLLVWRSVF